MHGAHIESVSGARSANAPVTNQLDGMHGRGLTHPQRLSQLSQLSSEVRSCPYAPHTPLGESPTHQPCLPGHNQGLDRKPMPLRNRRAHAPAVDYAGERSRACTAAELRQLQKFSARSAVRRQLAKRTRARARQERCLTSAHASKFAAIQLKLRISEKWMDRAARSSGKFLQPRSSPLNHWGASSSSVWSATSASAHARTTLSGVEVPNSSSADSRRKSSSSAASSYLPSGVGDVGEEVGDEDAGVEGDTMCFQTYSCA